MRAAKLYELIIVLFLCTFNSFSQKRLQIIYTRFGALKKYELFIDDPIRYKLKGERGFKKSSISTLLDSTVVLDNDEVVKLSSIRSIRFKRTNYYEKGLKFVLLKGAWLFPLITCVNNALHSNPPYLREGSIIVSLSLLGVYAIVRLLEIKRIRITKNKTLRIIDLDFQNLNQT